MSKKPDHKLFAIVSNQGTAMSETVLAEAEYNDLIVRAKTEEQAAKIGDCSKPIQWKDVTDNEALWEDTECKCDNCGYECEEDELKTPPVEHLWERLDPGSEVPAGECPKCGAFSYLVEEDDYDPTYHKMTREQRAAWLKSPSKCPYCVSENIEGTGETNADGDWYSNQVECKDCEAVWEEIYTICDVVGVDGPGVPVKPQDDDAEDEASDEVEER